MLVTVSLAVPFLFSCNKETPIASLESISVSYIDETDDNKLKELPSSFTLEKGKERVIKVTGNPVTTDRVFTWESSCPEAVQVISSTIKAYSVPSVEKNPVTITVADKEKTKSASFQITVLEKGAQAPVAPTGINMSQTNANLVIGDTLDLFATVTPLDAADRLVDWEILSGSTYVAFDGSTVDPNENAATTSGRKSSTQRIKALAEGVATIKATHRNNTNISATLGVTVTTEPGVIQVESISFVLDDVYVTEGDTTQNNLTIRPFNASDEAKEVEYSSSDTTKATVDQNSGIVTAVAPGTSIITATLKNDTVNPKRFATYTVHVEQRFVNYLHIKEVGTSVWINEELEPESENQHHISSRHFDRGDIFCFALNEGTAWYKYAELENKDANSSSICADGENLRILKSGNYEIYVKTSGHANPGIYIVSLSFDPVDLDPKLLVKYAAGGNADIAISLKQGSETEYEKVMTFNEGDSFVAKIGNETYGYYEIKEESTNQVLEGGFNNYIVVKGNLTLHIYVESGAPDSNGDFIYISTNFVQTYNPTNQKWSYNDISLKGGSQTEYNLLNAEFVANQKVLFYLNGHYFKFSDIKNSSPTKPYLDSDNDGNIVTPYAGTYTFYIETATEGGNGYGIYIDGLPSSSLVTYTLNLDGSNNWILNDSAKIYAWCWNSSTDKGSWIKGVINGNTSITFSVAVDRNMAKFIRCEHEVPDVSVWNDNTASGAIIWNTSDEISLPGSNSTINPSFH